MYLCITVDDINPSTEQRWIDEMLRLSQTYGCAYTLFVPSHYHGISKNRLSNNKEWVKDLLDMGCFELAAHGHYHACDDSEKHGEREFFELGIKSYSECFSRVGHMIKEWESTDLGMPSGWKSPGWLISHRSAKIVRGAFPYVVENIKYNKFLEWGPAVKLESPNWAINDVNLAAKLKAYSEDFCLIQSHTNKNPSTLNNWNAQNISNLEKQLEQLRSHSAQYTFTTCNQIAHLHQ